MIEEFEYPIFKADEMIREVWVNIYCWKSTGLHWPARHHRSQASAEECCRGAAYRLHIIPKAVRAC